MERSRIYGGREADDRNRSTLSSKITKHIAKG